MKNIFEDAKFGDVFIGADVEEFNMTMARNPLPLGGGVVDQETLIKTTNGARKKTRAARQLNAPPRSCLLC